MALKLLDPNYLRPAARQTLPKLTTSKPVVHEPEGDPDKPSIARRVGNFAGGGLSVYGNVLDLPGSMVRDTLRGHNPFDQLLTPTSDENRTTGRDLLRHYGAVGKEDTWGNFAGGLAADIALDPLTYLSGGASAVAKKGAGGLAKAAGVLGDAVHVAAKARGVPLGAIGANEARLTTTLAHYAQHAPEAFEKVKKSAAATGVPLTPELMNKPLGSLYRFAGMPVGTGETATRVARAIDTTKDAVKFAKVPGTNFAPVNELHRLYDSTIGEATNKLHQMASKALFRKKGEAAADIATDIAGDANTIKGAMDDHGLGPNPAPVLNPKVPEMTRDQLYQGFVDAYGKEEADHYMPLVDARAQTFGHTTGRAPGRYYGEIFAGVKKTKAADLGADALKQADPSTANRILQEGLLKEKAKIEGRPSIGKMGKHVPDDEIDLTPRQGMEFDPAQKTFWREHGKNRHALEANSGLYDLAKQEGEQTSKRLRDALHSDRDAKDTHDFLRDWVENKFTPSDHPVLNNRLEALRGFQGRPLEMVDEFRSGELRAKDFADANGLHLPQDVADAYDAHRAVRNRKVELMKSINEAESALNNPQPKTTWETTPGMKQDVSGPNLLFQSTHLPASQQVDPFYSKLERVVGEKVRGKIGPEQLMATLKTAGVTDEEIADMGLHDFMAGKKAVTPDELRKHIAANKLQMEVKILGHDPSYKPKVLGKEVGKDQTTIHFDTLDPEEGKISYRVTRDTAGKLRLEKAYNGDFSRKINIGNDGRLDAFLHNDIKPFDSMEEVNRVMKKDLAEHAPNQAVFRNFAVGGGVGGKDYKELLFKRALPEGKKAKGFSGSHFNEQQPNNLAHARVDTIVDPDGKKIMRIHEIQSDWHQQGKDVGYDGGSHLSKLASASNAVREARKAFQDVDSEWFEMRERSLRGELPENELSRYDEVTTKRSELQNQLDLRRREFRNLTASANDNIPDAPLKKGWPKHVLRQVIHHAIETGHDAIGIVKGSDIAKAVGGPEDELGTFYDKILAGHAKDLTKQTPYKHEVTPIKSVSKIQTSRGEVDINDLDPMTRADIMKYRSKSTGELNVFPLDKVKDKILKEGQPMYQAGDRAAVQFLGDHRAILHALEHADPSSLGHELGHVFRRDLMRNDPSLHAEAEKALGIAPGATWTRDHEEQFAEQFEKYLSSGQAPTAGLQRVFEKFKEWLTNIYRSIAGSPLHQNMNPQLKEVFDNMLNGKGGNYGFDKMSAPNMRRFLELKAGQPSLPLEAHAWRSKTRAQQAADIARAQDEGAKAGELADDAINYFPREMTEGAARALAGKGKAFSTADQHLQGRNPLYGGIPEGTDLINEIGSHPELQRLLDSGATEQQIAEWMHRTYVNEKHPIHGSRLPFDYHTGEFKQVTDPTTGAVSSEPVMKARVPELIQNLKKIPKEIRKVGIFANDPIIDEAKRRLSAQNAHLGRHAIYDALAEPGQLLPASKAAQNEGTKSVAELLHTLELEPGNHEAGALKHIAAKLGINVPDEIAKETAAQAALGNKGFPASAGEIVNQTHLQPLLHRRITDETHDNLTRMLKPVSGPEPVGPLMDFGDSVLNLTKAGQTSPWLGFHARNFTSGQIANAFERMWGSKDVSAMNKLLKGQVVLGAKDNPAIKKMYKDRKLTQPLDDTLATNLMGEMLHGQGAVPRFAGASDVTGKANAATPKTVGDITSGVPRVGRQLFSYKKLIKMALGREPGTTLLPWKAKVRGVNGATESTFGPLAAGNYLGSRIEALNRGAPILNQTRQGVDPHAAATRVGDVQANYGGEHFTRFERDVMKRVFPYYPFSKAMLKYVPQHLAANPGGPMAQSIRLANAAHNPDESTPDYIRDTISAPLNGVPVVGNAPEGTSRYLSGLGLMHEDPLSFVGNGPSGALLEAASRLNPLLKGPLEAATNQSFFQRSTAGGGRSLDDLDPTIGRIISNATGKKEATTFPGSKAVEAIAGNSPVSRALTTVRQLTDPRKNAAVKGLNTLTGLRISDVSPAAKEALMRERAQVLMKELGAKNFLRTYFPKEDLEAMSPREREQAMEYQQLLNDLAKKAKDRKSAASK